MNLETKITIYKFTPQVFTLTPEYSVSTKYVRCKFRVFLGSSQVLVRDNGWLTHFGSVDF